MAKMQLRLSQVVSTFGPGAMVDLPDVSVIVAGLDHWQYDRTSLPVVEEPRLVATLRKILNVPTLTLRTPPPSAEQDHGFQPRVTGFQFPEWFLVQRDVRGPAGWRRRRLVHADSLENGKHTGRDGKKDSVVPIRFVRACPKGHVGDVDWKAFVHGSPSECHRDLWIEERGTSGDLNDIWVICECGVAPRPMSQAARRELRALGHCNGSRPWLGPGTREACGEVNRLLIRSASNAYFPQALSVISIPDVQAGIDAVVRSAWDEGLVIVDAPEKLALVRQIPSVAQKLSGFEDEALYAAIERVRVGAEAATGKVKEVEFVALSEAKQEIGSDVPDGHFYARMLPAENWKARWTEPIERVVLVHRLREVTAQVGFTRFEPAAPDINGDLDLAVQRAPLAVNEAWLPAVENRGEGIFLQIRSPAVSAWCEREAVKSRGHALEQGFQRWKAERNQSKRVFPGLPYYLLHSLSHLLMTAISLECGYPASSLRERIYVGPEHFGILIYTGSSDSEGTLGGLVAAGRQIRRHLHRALELGSICSNDPVCAYHSPSTHDHQALLGSACHGCLLIAETSCEQRNDYLDRALVVPTIEARGAEFFEAML